MLLSEIENTVVTLLVEKGPICGTAQVAYALWPDREMKPQGAAVAVGGILRRVQEMGFVDKIRDKNTARYVVTEAGRAALLSDTKEAIEQRVREGQELKRANEDKKTKKAAAAAAWVDNLKKNDGWRFLLDLDAVSADELRTLVAASYGSSAAGNRKPTARAAVQQAIHEAFERINKTA